MGAKARPLILTLGVMRKSTKHAIAQRLLGLVGLALFLAPIVSGDLHSTPTVLLALGFLLLGFAILSGMGLAPWGRHYSSLYVAESEAKLKSLEAKQSWQ